MVTTNCCGRCSPYIVKGTPGNNRYADGQKRCDACGFIKWDGIFCPCCNNRLRCKPRNPKYRRKMEEILKQRSK